MTDKLLREAARRYARAALAEAQQGDGLGLKMVDGWGVFDTLENGGTTSRNTWEQVFCL
jgi:hypothetical protein